MLNISKKISFFLLVCCSIIFYSCKKTADVPIPAQDAFPTPTILKIQVFESSLVVKDATVQLYNTYQDLINSSGPAATPAVATGITDSTGIAIFSTPAASLTDSQYYFKVTAADGSNNLYDTNQTNLFRLDEKLQLQKTTLKSTTIKKPSVSK